MRPEEFKHFQKCIELGTRLGRGEPDAFNRTFPDARPAGWLRPARCGCGNDLHTLPVSAILGIQTDEAGKDMGIMLNCLCGSTRLIRFTAYEHVGEGPEGLP